MLRNPIEPKKTNRIPNSHDPLPISASEPIIFGMSFHLIATQSASGAPSKIKKGSIPHHTSESFSNILLKNAFIFTGLSLAVQELIYNFGLAVILCAPEFDFLEQPLGSLICGAIIVIEVAGVIANRT